MVETKFLVHLCIPRSPKQCVEVKKQVFECVNFRILPISVALNFSLLPSAMADVCAHLWVCVRGYVCECVYWRGRVSGPRLLLSINIYWAILTPIISPVIWPFSLPFHRSCPSYKAFSSLVSFILHVCVYVFLVVAWQRVNHSLCHSLASRTLRYASQPFLLYSSIAVLGTRERGFLSPQAPQGREKQMSLLYFSQPPWSCDHADPPEDQVSKQGGSMGEHLSSSLFFLSPLRLWSIVNLLQRQHSSILHLLSHFIFYQNICSIMCALETHNFEAFVT